MTKTLIADCGATKADWYVSGGPQFCTAGFNLAQTPEPQLQAILDDVSQKLGSGITQVYFYAAGLVGNPPVDLGRWFPGAAIEYASDMVGAARAVCGRNPGLAVILGTGANTCQWNGEKITRKVPSGGFIVGDEGSAAVLGKLFVTDFLKDRVPENMAEDFRQQFPADYPTLVKNIYGAGAPARYLGGFAPFILSYYTQEEYARKLIDNNFRSLFERAIGQYDSLPMGVVGSFGYTCRDILKDMAAQYGIQISNILPSPMEGLIHYHGV